MSLDTLSATVSPLSAAFNAAKSVFSGIQGSFTLAEALGDVPGAFQ